MLILFLYAEVAYSQSVMDEFQKSTYGSNADHGHWATIRGFKMYYETYGSGMPLLLIHGNGGSIRDFFKNIPELSKHYRVIVADSRSQGKSTDDSDSISYEMMADDLDALLTSLQLDSCFVVGWSDGGINGLLLAIRHPDKVKKLAVTGANLWPDTSAVDADIIKLVSNENDALKKENETPEIKHQLKLNHLLLFEPHIATTQLSTIKCPVLVMGGDHDVIRTNHTLLIAESIPKSNLLIFPDSGHSTPVFYSEKFNTALREFFNKPYREIKGRDRFF